MVNKTKRTKRTKEQKENVINFEECVFPFKYKRNVYNNCVDTGKGPWCATKLTKTGCVDKWSYCNTNKKKPKYKP